MVVIFDLDQTLIDSRAAEDLRRTRRWAEVYRLVPFMPPYGGIEGLLQWLSDAEIPIGIVTSSPSTYCSRVVAHWGWRMDVTVCYHDTARRKPHPDPILLALGRLNAGKEECASVGDEPRDIVASRAAGVFSVGASCGCKDLAALRAANPDAETAVPSDLQHLLKARLGLT